ncbi:MAG: response regulator [Treponemataceae bacterium]|nr:response regulator [Treponemataceae bacterium]
MTIYACDDEHLGLEGLVNAIREAEPDASIYSFRDGSEAIEYCSKIIPDVAFLDIEMKGENGISVAKNMKEVNPRVNIIFVTGYSNFMKEAFDLYASGYILKPVDGEDIKKQFANLRYTVKKDSRLEAKTFGAFELFYDGKPLRFKYSRSKELIAILIDAKGLPCSAGKIEEFLWEDNLSDHRSYIRNLISDIKNVFTQHGIEDVINREPNNMSINCTKIKCDYFEYLNGKSLEELNFQNEYMSQYSWAESTLASLLKLKNK